MANKPTLSAHNEIVLRPPPGAAFIFWGADLVLRFERGKEREMHDYLVHWMQTQVFATVIRAEAQAKGVAPDYSGISAASVPTVAAPPAGPSVINDGERCPMGCGEAVDAFGRKYNNINPACPTHGNPAALYGRKPEDAEPTNDSAPDKPEGT